MPHIIVKLWPGKSEEQKKAFTESIVKEAMAKLGSKETSLSVAFEEIAEEDWPAKVSGPEIKAKWDELYKQPGVKPE